MEHFASTSTEPLAVRAIRTDTNPTANTVAMFLKAVGAEPPATTDVGWVTGTWQTTAQQSNGLWKTDAWFTLTANAYTDGIYDVYIWIDGSTYDPVRLAGTIAIY